MPQPAAQPMRVSISSTEHTLDIGGHKVAWTEPPRVLTPLLWDLFGTQPEDVLTWLHTAVWELRAGESRRSSWAHDRASERGSIVMPVEAHSSVITTESAVSAVPNETTLAMPLGKRASGATNSHWGTRGSSSPNQVRIASVPTMHEADETKAIRHSANSDCNDGLRYHDVAGMRLPLPVELPSNHDGRSAYFDITNLPSITAHASETHREPMTNIQSVQSANSRFGKEVSQALSAASEGCSSRHSRKASSRALSEGVRTSRTSNTSAKESNFGITNSLASRGTLGSLFSSHRFGFDHLKNAAGIGNGQPRLMKAGMGSFRSGVNLGQSDRFQECFNPTRRLSLIWTLVYVICFFVELWVTLLEIVFSPEGQLLEWSESADVILLIIFLLDIPMNFLTGYFWQGFVITNRRKVVRGYLMSWFSIDAVSLLPYILSLSVGKKGRGRAARSIKLVRILRMERVQGWATCIWHAIWRHVSLRLHNKVLIVIEAVKIQVVLLVFANVLAILWAATQPSIWAASDAEGAYKRYFESLAWAYACLTCGESMPPVEHAHHMRALEIVGAVARLLLFMLLATSVMQAHALNSQDAPLWRQRVVAHLGRRGVSIATQISASHSLRQRNAVQQQQSRIDKFAQQHLPTRLRRELLNELWSERIMTLGLIQCLVQWHSTFALELAACVKEEIFASWSVLFRCGELAQTAYHVLRGVLAVSQTEHKPLADYTGGQWVGELALVNSELVQTETLVCKERCELMAVPASAFRKLIARLGLDSRFEHFLHRTLWMGFCGRCGYFGDHFSKDCPLLQRPTWANRIRASLTRLTESKSFRPEDFKVDVELARFLEAYQLEELQSVLPKYNIRSLNDLMTAAVEEMLADTQAGDMDADVKRSFARLVRHFRRKMASCSSEVLANSGGAENHLIFISHYKVEAGTEAALMQKDLEALIEDDPSSPGHGLMSPIFVDSENLRNLNDLQDFVQRSHNLVLLLTPGVLGRPWVLVEIVTAMKEGVNIVPVEIQRVDLAFKFPDDVYFRNLREGKQLDQEATELLASEGIDLEDLEKALRQVFKRIAIPFSPHKPNSIRQAELSEVLKQCTLRSQVPSAARKHNSIKSVEGSRGLDEVVDKGYRSRSETDTSGMAVLKRQSTRNRLSSAAGRATDDLYPSQPDDEVDADDQERESVARRLSERSFRRQSHQSETEFEMVEAIHGPEESEWKGNVSSHSRAPEVKSLRASGNDVEKKKSKMSSSAASILEDALTESLAIPRTSSTSTTDFAEGR